MPKARPDQPLPDPSDDRRIQPIELHQEMQRSYLEYAMSVIVGRALPDARDGLKPVQRRSAAVHRPSPQSRCGTGPGQRRRQALKRGKIQGF